MLSCVVSRGFSWRESGRTLLQFFSGQSSLSSGKPSMSMSGPQRYPLPAQPTPHCQDVDMYMYSTPIFKGLVVCQWDKHRGIGTVVESGVVRHIFGTVQYNKPGQLLSEPIKSSPSLFPEILCHLTFNFALPVDDALSAGMAGVGLTISTGSLRLAAAPLIPNVASLTGPASKGALVSQWNKVVFYTSSVKVVTTEVVFSTPDFFSFEHFLSHERVSTFFSWKINILYSQGCSCRQNWPRSLRYGCPRIHQYLYTPSQMRGNKRCHKLLKRGWHSVFTGTDLFVGGGVGNANALDLRAAEPCRTGAAAKARRSVDAAYTHVTRLDRTLHGKQESNLTTTVRGELKALGASCTLCMFAWLFFCCLPFVHLVHIRAVATVSLHALGTRPTLHPLRCFNALHPRVARVGHARGTKLDPPHTWTRSK